ncbi:pfkB-like carbohydrate kinase family protein [Striga asiatica]|uniref:PfkB-like carbohydrate kinase family protein n=1 Tax=Striga asiatica TaxID=4170 RepID=A0A5A7P5K9_STRAF|nr:pfkB-like carbohydrate kinase family protein [Striga asiatica]
MVGNRKPTSCLVVGNYCHDVLMKDDVVLGESLGGAAAFVSAVLDGVAVPSTVVAKVGPDFAYPVTHPPSVIPSSGTTLFHAHFSSQVQRQDRVLRRVRACDPIGPSDLPESRRFDFGLAVGVGGEILPDTLEKMLDICETVLVDVQALIRVFDGGDGTVRLVKLRDSGFYHLLPRIGFLKASSDEAPYIDVDQAKNACCVVLTNGEEGCRVHYRDVEQHIAPFPSVQVDPTGAGDSFLGGLVFGLVQGLNVPDAALLGNFFGSLTVSHVGLPKFDLGLLQAVKNEVQRKKLQLFSCREELNEKLVFAKPLDHDDFHKSLVRAKNLPLSHQECQLELPPGSSQVTLFSGNSHDEPIKLGNGIP